VGQVLLLLKLGCELLGGEGWGGLGNHIPEMIRFQHRACEALFLVDSLVSGNTSQLVQGTNLHFLHPAPVCTGYFNVQYL